MLLISQPFGAPFPRHIAEISGFGQQVLRLIVIHLPLAAVFFFSFAWLFSPSSFLTVPAISPLFDGRVTLAEGTRKEY